MLIRGLFQDNLLRSAKLNMKVTGHRQGSMFDGGVFNVGKILRVCIVAAAVGETASRKFIEKYSNTDEYVRLSADIIIAINVGVGDQSLVIMIMCYLCAAKFSDVSERNEVSPAEVIASCICDVCISLTETGTAVIGSMMQVMQNIEVHVMNMSYVDHPHYSVSGRVTDMMPELIDNYEPVWISHAGNESPALTTSARVLQMLILMLFLELVPMFFLRLWLQKILSTQKYQEHQPL